jgi:hypothetical protein
MNRDRKARLTLPKRPFPPTSAERVWKPSPPRGGGLGGGPGERRPVSSSGTRTRPLRFAAFLAGALIVSTGHLLAQDRDSSSKEDQAARLVEMKQLVQTFRASKFDGPRLVPVELRPEPFGRWNDPTRDFSDGSLWLWGGKGRPVAALGIEIYPDKQVGSNWSLEFVSLSTAPVAVDGGTGFDFPWPDLAPPSPDGQVHWAPKEPGLTFRDIPDAPAPGKTPAERLRQMKALSRRFAAAEYHEPLAQTYTLRLLPTPIDRYDDPASGLLDGAIFAFASGTNPEVLLMIEAQGREPSSASWRYALARISQAGPTVSLDQKDVWSLPWATRPGPKETYFIIRKVRGKGGSGPGREP